MEIKIVGDVTVSALLALVAAFTTEAAKRAINESYHRFLPLPIAAFCIVIGSALAWGTGNDPVEGAQQGFVGAALAVFGYEFVKGVISPAVERIRNRPRSG